MKERFTEVANISTDVLSELGKLVSAYKDYTETLAAVQKQIEYTKEYKEKQTQTARENLVRKTAGTCDTIRIQLESLENTVNSLDQTLNVADPELMPCVGLLANSPEALPLELIGSVAEKFKGNRLALLALAAVAKENNKSFLEGKAVDGQEMTVGGNLYLTFGSDCVHIVETLEKLGITNDEWKQMTNQHIMQ